MAQQQEMVQRAYERVPVCYWEAVVYLLSLAVPAVLTSAVLLLNLGLSELAPAWVLIEACLSPTLGGVLQLMGWAAGLRGRDDLATHGTAADHRSIMRRLEPYLV